MKNMKHIIDNLGLIIQFLAIFGVVIEVTPIKLSPLKNLLSNIRYVLDNNDIGIKSNLYFGFFILLFFSKI